MRQELIDGVSDLAAEVDGVPVPFYSEASPTFPITVDDDNIFGLPAGVYPFGAADGYYVMLAQPHPGVHTVHFHQVFPGAGPIDATYSLTVSPTLH